MSAVAICDECDCAADHVLCDGCAEADGAALVRAWLDKERCKPSVTISAETIAAFERCIDDLR